MTDATALDAAHARMEASPGDDAARLAFFERLADCELFLLLGEEAQGDSVTPELFDIADGRFVLAFDREDRLARFTERPAPYAAMSGRVLSRMLAEQGIGVGLNLEVAPSSILIPAEAIAWLDATLGQGPDQVEDRVSEVSAPIGLPEHLITALDAKLSTAGGLAQAAYLVGVTYENGARGHLLAFIGAIERAQDALAKAVSEALTFSGIEAGTLDVGFFDVADAVSAQFAKHGLKFDLPEPVDATTQRTAPGRDPDRPPLLR